MRTGISDFIGVSDQGKLTVEKPARSFRKESKGPSTLATGMRHTASFFKNYYVLPSNLVHFLKITKLFKIVLIPFHCIDAYNNICDTTAPLKEHPLEALKNRVRPILKLIIALDEIVESIGDGLEFLKHFKLVGERAVEWIPVFRLVDFWIKLMGTGFAVETVCKTGKLYHSLRSTNTKFAKEADEGKKATILLEALKKLKKDDIEGLRKRLMLSKAADLKGRVDKIASILKKQDLDEAARKETLEEGKKLMEILASRATTQLTIACVDLANRIAMTVGAVFLTFVYVPVAGYAIFSCTSVVSLGLWGTKYFIIKKNPFDPNAKTRAQKRFSQAKAKYAKATAKIRSFCYQRKPVAA